MTRKPDESTAAVDNQDTNTMANPVVVKPVDQLTSKPDNQATKEQEREVSLCVKVPESLRRHSAAEFKRHGVTMTQVIVQALRDRFGTPPH